MATSMADELAPGAHTASPWHVDEGMISVADQAAMLTDEWCAIATGEHMNDEESVVALAHPSNARRIVACVNACAGLSTESLGRIRLRETLERCESFLSGFEDDEDQGPSLEGLLATLRSLTADA